MRAQTTWDWARRGKNRPKFPIHFMKLPIFWMPTLHCRWRVPRYFDKNQMTTTQYKRARPSQVQRSMEKNCRHERNAWRREDKACKLTHVRKSAKGKAGSRSWGPRGSQWKRKKNVPTMEQRLTISVEVVDWFLSTTNCRKAPLSFTNSNAIAINTPAAKVSRLLWHLYAST